MTEKNVTKRIYAFLIDLAISFVIGMGFSGFNYSFLVPFIIFGLYYILLDLSPIQGTIGEYLMKLKVVNSNGNKINLSQSIARHIGRLITIFTFNYVNKFQLFKDEMFHDKYSHTKLVNS